MTVTAPKVRPEIEWTIPLSEEQIIERLKAALARGDQPIRGLFAQHRIELVPDPTIQHVWSPQLTADLEPSASDEADASTRVHVRFGPHPHVWSLYLAVHATGAFATLGAAVFGYSQYLAGSAPTALWALPAAPVLAALVWAFAFVGQGLSAEQMYTLRRFMERALDDTLEDSLDDRHDHALEAEGASA